MTGARSHSGTKTDKSQDHSPSVTQTARLPSKRQHKKPRTNRGRYPQGTTHASKVAAVLTTSSRFSNQTGRVSASRVSAANEFFFVVFWRSKGRGAMPQGHENKRNKTIRQKEKQKARVTYRVKRPPKWEGAPPYGASPPTSPGNRTPPPY